MNDANVGRSLIKRKIAPKSMRNHTIQTIHRKAFNAASSLIVSMALAVACACCATTQQAQTSNQAISKPVWPDSGVAQRMFPNGGIMFVENDRGTWRAWVLQLKTSGSVQALDFFSGKRMRVEVAREEDGKQESIFTDAKGVAHAPEDKGFQFSGTALPIELPGIDFDGDGHGTSLKSSKNYCFSNLIATTPAHELGKDKGATLTWSKLAIYHLAGVTECPRGNYDSKITSALDLDDGTFLAVEGCFIFHLRKLDLSPVGSALALRVLDKKTVQAALDKAKNEGVLDSTDYVVKALNLPAAPELSCKED